VAKTVAHHLALSYNYCINYNCPGVFMRFVNPTLPRPFGELFLALIDHIHQLSLEQLRQAVSRAFEVADMAEFEMVLRGCFKAPSQ